MPSISVVVPAYNSERFIAATLASILAQTRGADEVIVVDDGSTDGTPAVLAGFKGELRVVRQANRGHSGAMNRGFAEARGDYVARCDADDLWEPTKLERQAEAVARHPEIDLAFTGAETFGAQRARFLAPPGSGLLEPRALARSLYRHNYVCAPSALMSRRLYERVGPFSERIDVAEDYDYWLRALDAKAVWFYDGAVQVRCRRHESNATNDRLRLARATYRVHAAHAHVAGDRRLVRAVVAGDLARIGRLLVDAGRTREARALFGASLRERPTAAALAWSLLLSAPERSRGRLVSTSVRLKRALG